MIKFIFPLVVLIAFTTSIFAQNGHSCSVAKPEKTDKACHKESSSDKTVAYSAAIASIEEIQVALKVQGKCDMCKSKIENAAKSVEGVSSAVWDAKKKELSLVLNSDQTNADAVSRAIADIGYDSQTHKADKKVYNALPACCKYR